MNHKGLSVSVVAGTGEIYNLELVKDILKVIEYVGYME